VRSALAEPGVVQVLVVDDASADATGAVAADLAQGDPRVEVVSRATRGGPGAARNEGIARVYGTLVCCLDADDAIVEGGLGVLAGALASTRGAVAAIGRFRAVDADGGDVDVGSWATAQLRPVVRRHGRLIECPDGFTSEALVTRLVSPPPGAWLVDVATLRAIGGYDARVRRSEDLELLVRLAAAGTIVGVEHEVLTYLRHPAQRSAAHARRRWGRGQALWSMLRAAPGARATLRLSGGMAAYHVALSVERWHAPSRRLRAMGARNLLVAGILRVAGVGASVLPRRMPAPLRALAVD